MFNYSHITKKISRLGYQPWNPIVKLVQCWDKEGRFLEDRNGQREEGHHDRTQYRVTYNLAYTKNGDLVCPGLNRPDHIPVSLLYLPVDP
jgi:hypothetical protein